MKEKHKQIETKKHFHLMSIVIMAFLAGRCLRERQRGQPGGVELREGRRRQGAARRGQEIAGVRLTSQNHVAEQGQRVLGLPEGVSGWRVPEGGQSVPWARRRLGCGGSVRVVVAGSVHTSGMTASVSSSIRGRHPSPTSCCSRRGYLQFLSNWGGQTPAGALDTVPSHPRDRAEHTRWHAAEQLRLPRLRRPR